MHLWWAMGFVLAFGLAPLAPARAATSVRVLETYPAGEHITLGRNQNFNLRLAYSTDDPIGIWVTPYFHGKPVSAGSSPSQTHSGSGETLAWFFFLHPGDEVDEIRITAGDGRTAITPLVATLPVRIVSGSDAAAEPPPPLWVSELGARAKAAQQQAYEARMKTPASAGDTWLFGGFMLAVPGLALLGFGTPLWMLKRWRGGWRVAAAVPASLMAFVVLRILLGVTLDATSHNLWPFEILRAGAMSTGLSLLLLIAHKLSGAGRTA